ncbi:MAG: N-(5'-phosphoribosyl)anthranilate isomerase [Candidatus Methanoperedenaceae archaeon]|nr:MAG: N-(5'-phosphoribosyl)anthranilate isomerase [Candidatus Methanoperedenaceae archaeon]
MKVKICGIKSERDLAMAIKAGTDAAGFITEVPVDSPRKITLDRASRLIALVPVFVTSVLVIMPKNAREAIEMIHTAKPDAVQIHNSLPINELREIRQTGVKLIKTILVPTHADARMLLDIVKDLSGIVDAVLLDTASGVKTGGTGVVHNWDLSSEIVQKAGMPVILAGGLNPMNVKDAVRCVRPYAVDTASGVETEGHKDENKLIDFIKNARSL